MYSKLSNSWLKHWDFMVLDVLSLQISFWLAYVIRHGFSNPFELTLYRSEALILLICQLLAVYFDNAFSGVLRRGFYVEFVKTAKHVLLTMALVLLALFVGKETGTYSRIVLVVTGALYGFISYVSRLILKHFVKKKAVSKANNSLLVVTTESAAQETIKELKTNTYQPFVIKGVCLLDKPMEACDMDGYTVLGGEDYLIDYACREWVDEVLFLLPNGTEVPQKLLDTLGIMGITTHVPVFTKNAIGSKQSIGKIGNRSVVTTSISIVDTKHMVLKRVMDILGGLVGCFFTLLLTIIVGPMIYIKSPGPIFFSQTRIGKNGRKFKIYKFRSMYLDAEERKKELMSQNKMSGLMFKMDYDPRIIGSEKIGKDGKPKGIGNFIRATSIDEFPQFWNVLKGDMSLVGTRPPTVDEWEQYEPHHRARMAIKPGITGMWQVSGRSDITDFEEVVQLDTEYIEKWNLGLDIKILLMTVVKVFKNDGAV